MPKSEQADLPTLKLTMQMQMVKLYGMVSASILRNHLPVVTVFQLTVKLMENVGEWTMMTDMELCLVMHRDWPGMHADLKEVTFIISIIIINEFHRDASLTKTSGPLKVVLLRFSKSCK